MLNLISHAVLTVFLIIELGLTAYCTSLLPLYVPSIVVCRLRIVRRSLFCFLIRKETQTNVASFAPHEQWSASTTASTSTTTSRDTTLCSSSLSGHSSSCSTPVSPAASFRASTTPSLASLFSVLRRSFGLPAPLPLLSTFPPTAAPVATAASSRLPPPLASSSGPSSRAWLSWRALAPAAAPVPTFASKRDDGLATGLGLDYGVMDVAQTVN